MIYTHRAQITELAKINQDDYDNSLIGGMKMAAILYFEPRGPAGIRELGATYLSESGTHVFLRYVKPNRCAYVRLFQNEVQPDASAGYCAVLDLLASVVQSQHSKIRVRYIGEELCTEGDDLMKGYLILGTLAVMLALSLGLLACGKSPEKTSNLSSAQAITESPSIEPFYLQAGDINKVTINSVTTAVPGEVNVVIDQSAEIKELIEILNNARPYSGAAPADRYAQLTFSMKDGSDASLEFNGHGLIFFVAAQASYILEPESKVKALNAFIDGLESH